MKTRQPRGTWLPAQAAASLAQLAYAERALAHVLAGWAVKMPSFEAKRAAAQQMHLSMERGATLRSRVNGLCHAVAGEATVPAGWRSLFVHIDRAPDAESLIAAIYRWLLPRLYELYSEHASATDPLGDRVSVDLIRGWLPLLKSEQREAIPMMRRGGAGSGAWLRSLDPLWVDRTSGEALALDEALWPPLDRVPAAVRLKDFRIAPPGSLGLLAVDPVHEPAGVAMFLHKELDEEYTTLELISRNSYEHPDMPDAFHRDMARQASDEARHALLIIRLMHARGIRHGDFSLSTSSYDGLYQFGPLAPGSRDELLWRILIRQTFDEGLAIDNLAREIERRRAAGQEDVAAAFEYILRDEVFHAASGLRWSRELTGSDRSAALRERAAAVAYFTKRAEEARETFVMANLDLAMGEVAAVQQIEDRRRSKDRDRSLNRTGRKQAGYDEDDVAQLVALRFIEPN